MQRRTLATLLLLLPLALRVSAADSAPQEILTPQERSEGWLLLFDGATPFGWRIEGDWAIKEGWLILGGNKATTATLPYLGCGYRLHFRGERQGEGQGEMVLETSGQRLSQGLFESHKAVYTITPGDKGQMSQSTSSQQQNQGPAEVTGTVNFDPSHPPEVRFVVPAKTTLRLRDIKALPTGLQPLFNGKDLKGWTVFRGDEKRIKSTFTVTPEGLLHMKNGPGDLQTEGQYDDFLLQLACRTNGKGLNSGVFFRCMPGQYQNGYEAQIHNVFKDGDRTRPADFGTGAIYRRIPARRVIPDDEAWFTLTVAAHGARIRTWVDGFPTVDWTDERAPNENPRNGLRTAKGHLSLQGHDPTTDVNFRNIRLVAWPVEKK